jgi:hypothetical protein
MNEGARFNKYDRGATLRIPDREVLERFRSTWKYHHKLDESQLAFAGRVARVERWLMYHGGDILYELDGVPGVWHEHLLIPAD